MPDKVIPEEIKQFIIQYIDSIAELEGLLLFHREQKTWDVPTLATRLYISEQEAKVLIKALLAYNFIDMNADNNTYIYNPKSMDIRSKIDQLSELYSKYLIGITTIIHSKPTKRIQLFADAFRIRKD